MLKNILAFALLLTVHFLNAQVTCVPVFPGPDDAVVITFNANEGNKGLASETGDIYAHTGVITDKSVSTSDWKYVKFPWTTNDASVKLTAKTGGLYTLSISNIRAFYGVPSSEKILKLAFVFRNSTGSKEGKTAAGGDIFYDVNSDLTALKTTLISPSVSQVIATKNQPITVKGSATLASTITIYDNWVSVTSSTNVKELTYDINPTVEGLHTVTFKAESAGKVDSSSFTYFLPPAITVANPPAGMELGANFNATNDTVTLLLQAPNKQSVFVLGSFNDYQLDKKYQMNRSVDGKTWWISIGGLTSGQTYTYQYLVDGVISIADPLSTLLLDRLTDGSVPAITFPNMPSFPAKAVGQQVSVLQPGKAAYQWKTTNFKRPEKKDLIIYELHTRDFIARHDFQTLIDTLSYLKTLGITAIEMMPVSEFEGNESWGYNVSYHMSLDKYYGTSDKLKEFIDVCHANGIAVIFDVVYNHAFGQNPLFKLYSEGSTVAANSPYFNITAPHPYSVGYDFNHSSEFTKNYVNRIIKYWLKEFNIDGYRFDLTKGFTQNSSTEATASLYDQSRIDILKGYYKTTQDATPGSYMICEHFCENKEETVLADAGMLVWANVNFNTNEATMGWSTNSLTRFSAKSYGWNDAKHDKYVAYMESHDEERLMYKNVQFGNANGAYSVKDPIVALRRIELANVFFYAVPGPRMLWQFGELGYDYNIDFNGRTGNKPIRWDYFQDANRRRLYNITRNMIALRKSNTAFSTLNYSEADLLSGYQKAYHIQDADLSVTIIGNFDVQAADITPAFQATGKWYNYITGDSITVTDKNGLIRLLPGEYRVYTSKKLTPPAGYFRYTTTPTVEFAEQVNEFMIYPNPSVSGKTFIGYNLRNASEVKWEVYNLTGQIVASQQAKKVVQGSHQDELNVTLPTGTYMVKLSVNGATATQKLIVSQ